MNKEVVKRYEIYNGQRSGEKQYEIYNKRRTGEK